MAENFFMKQKIAIVTEWAWSNHLLSSSEKLQAFAHVVFAKISEAHPGVRTNKVLAIREIEHDLFRCVLKLSYGGRKPADISDKRKALLTEATHSFFL
jgi:hypothetical protein